MHEKNMKRAQRRHHKHRIAAKRQRYLIAESLVQSVDQNQRHMAALMETPKPCSCWMCGNPRKYFGEVTLQERKARDKQQPDDDLDWDRLESTGM